jgi:hypothetical protein
MPLEAPVTMTARPSRPYTGATIPGRHADGKFGRRDVTGAACDMIAA